MVIMVMAGTATVMVMEADIMRRKRARIHPKGSFPLGG